jgi:thioredoxin reductase (NADPH)
MSRNLIDQIERHPRIVLEPQSQVHALLGNGRLHGVDVHDPEHGSREVPVSALFVFIGAQPCTDWLQGQLASENGFLVTGGDLGASRSRLGGLGRCRWRPAGPECSASEMPAPAP